MPRKFHVDTTSSISLDAAGVGFGWTFGTLAFVMWHNDAWANRRIFATYRDVADGGFNAGNNNYKLDWRSSTGFNNRETSSSLPSENRYELIAFTKTAGTSYARAHRFIFNTGNWAHEDCTVGGGASGQPNVLPTLIVGGDNYDGSSPGSYMNSELWALGAWQGVVMTDSEVERLPSGNWPSKSPGLYLQFTDANEVGPLARSCGRHPIRQSSATGTTTRGLRPPPSGFRMSPLARRR